MLLMNNKFIFYLMFAYTNCFYLVTCMDNKYRCMHLWDVLCSFNSRYWLEENLGLGRNYFSDHKQGNYTEEWNKC